MMTIIFLSTNAYAKTHTTTINNKTIKFNTQADLELFNEYNKKLNGLSSLANELVKAKAEFIENIIKTKRFDRYKTEVKKIKKAEGAWNSIMRQLLTNKESSGYRRIHVQAPEFTKYVVKNYEELMKNENITMPIGLIKDHYDITQLIRSADEKNRSADEKNRSADEKNRSADEKNRSADEKNRSAEKYKKISENFRKLT